MNRDKIKRYLSAVDLHDERSRKLAIYACLAFLIVLSLWVRKDLINYQSGDYLAFSNWYNFIKAHGFHSFRYNYSNYNPPYTYFLYIATLLPVSKIVAIKSLLFLFDICLAISVYFVVRVFKPGNYLPLIAATVTMFLPTVLVTGVMWGQFDDFYVAAMLFSLFFALRGNSLWTWIAFGTAMSIKFQAIFFLPVLAILIFKRIRWYDAFWGVVTFLVLTLLPMFAGRSLGSLLRIYPSQTQVGNGLLNLNAPGLFAWFPNSTFPYVYHMGIGLGVAVCVFILLFGLQYKKFSKRDILLCTTLVLYAVPFFLPEMHERYFFPADIASMILAFSYTTKLNVAIAALTQVITLFSYSPFLFGTTPVPMSILAVFTLLIILALGYQYFTPSTLTPTSTKKLTAKKVAL